MNLGATPIGLLILMPERVVVPEYNQASYNYCMKKLLPFVFVIFLLCACSNVVDNTTGQVSFFTKGTRGVSASIEYPTTLDKTWTVTATKTDTGNNLGEGVYEDFLLTDTLGTFSVGAWSFALQGYSGNNLIFEGEVDFVVRAGNNSIPVAVHTVGAKGTLSVDGCNYTKTGKGNVTRVILKVDDEDLNTWVIDNTYTPDGEYYELPGFSKKIEKGIHTMSLRYMTGETWTDSEPVAFRIDAQAITMITIGIQEVEMGLNVTIETVEAIVES